MCRRLAVLGSECSVQKQERKRDVKNRKCLASVSLSNFFYLFESFPHKLTSKILNIYTNYRVSVKPVYLNVTQRAQIIKFNISKRFKEHLKIIRRISDRIE